MSKKYLLGLIINSVGLALMAVVFYLSFIFSKQASGDTFFSPLKQTLLFLCFAAVPIYLVSLFTNYFLGKFVYQKAEGIIRTAYPNGGSLDMNSRAELEAHRELFKSLYSYVGSYPAWKVQQEFRELILSLNPPAEHCAYHFHNIDAYLGKLVDEINKVRKFHDESISKGYGWDNEILKQARGDFLLPEIAKKHTDFAQFKKKETAQNE